MKKRTMMNELLADTKKIAILIPCYNEALTIEKVVKDFKNELPSADIYVYDNNSVDDTAVIAEKAGAIVRPEYIQGKGAAVRSMFRDIDADIYVMVDGDDTYPANEVMNLIEPVKQGRADMVIGDRLSSTYYTENKRPFHNFGNDLVRWLVNVIYGSNIRDVMTGYRAFSKRFVKSIPVISNGFQIETEMTIFALENNLKLVNVPVTYRDRPEGSVSKLNTVKDGIKVLCTIADMTRHNQPLMFYTLVSIFMLIISLLTRSLIFTLVAWSSLAIGLICDSLNRKAKENREINITN